MTSEELIECIYGEPECVPEGDYEEMCDDHRREHGENIADMRDDLD